MLYLKVKYIVKEFVAGLITLCFGLQILKFLLRKKRVYYVFNYHSFSRYNNYKVKRGSILETGYQENFEKQICFFKKHFEFTYPEDFFKNKDIKNPLLITFDDGYKDNYDLAFPVLIKHNAKAIFFIVTSLTGTKDMLFHDKIRLLVELNKLDNDYLNIPVKINYGVNEYTEEVKALVNSLFKDLNIKTRTLLNKDEIKEMYEQGLEIGVHTHNHQPLSLLNIEDQDQEIKNCLNIINSLGIDSNSIAYPNGLYNENSIKASKKNGLEFGFTIEGGLNLNNTHPFKIKRMGLNMSDSKNVIVLKLFMNYLKDFK